ncbi:glycosyltransferase family protein [Tenacibaculum agarivorans]|uniref:DUF1972 domain-containing protein n=1 Tax=Tenacibaculum agarivorans TaxID=1908389 RepID=UPI00094B8220|nr:DUF1972 domain-containing protein [Tenacibaculum agarivorans]
MDRIKKKKIAIIGSHGLYAKYGGWDQLVNNLAEKKSDEVEYIIFNSSDTEYVKPAPDGVEVKKMIFKAAGYQGFFYDFYSILLCYFKVDVLVLLGAQGMPIIPLLSIFKKKTIITNIGGIEWERPKYNKIIKSYFRYCFRLAKKRSTLILDNEHYKKFIPKGGEANYKIIPYGGEIDDSLSVTNEMIEKYPFLEEDYFLSISRSLKDNMIAELCESFINLNQKLVLISNLSRSEYGLKVLKKYSGYKNIVLIDGLYNKPELDLVRRKCKAYIHTHTLCGTAPSLVEMIISGRPILSIDIPQNRYTLENEGRFYKNFEELSTIIKDNNDLTSLSPSESLQENYYWEKIVNDYEALY